MPTQVDCPSCSQTVLVPEEYVRKSWSCPACRHRFVPDPAIHVERPPVEAGSSHAPAASGAACELGAGGSGGRGGFGWSALGAAFAAGALAGAALTWLARG